MYTKLVSRFLMCAPKSHTRNSNAGVSLFLLNTYRNRRPILNSCHCRPCGGEVSKLLLWVSENQFIWNEHEGVWCVVFKSGTEDIMWERMCVGDSALPTQMIVCYLLHKHHKCYNHPLSHPMPSSSVRACVIVNLQGICQAKLMNWEW